MPVWFHVTSTLNRASIEQHGLDWTRMGVAPGIAGSTEPEVAGCYVCREHDVSFFLRLNNTGGPVDVWGVELAADEAVVVSGNGFEYVARSIARDHLVLDRTDVAPGATGSGSARQPPPSDPA